MIILVGPPGAGKTTIRQRLEDEGWTGFEASDFIKTAEQRHGVSTLDELRLKAGPHIAARMIAEKLKHLPSDHPTVISGFRSPNEIKHIKAQAKALVVGLYLNPTEAYNRVKQRQQSSHNLSFSEFTNRVEADYALGLANILHHHTDVYLNTHRDIEEIIKDIKALNPMPKQVHQTSATNYKYADRIAIAKLARI